MTPFPTGRPWPAGLVSPEGREASPQLACLRPLCLSCS